MLQIQDDGPSKAIRNAVGVDGSGKAHFVISGAPVSFGQLARYYRDVLKVSNVCAKTLAQQNRSPS